MTEVPVVSYKQPHQSSEPQKLEQGLVGTTQQGYDTSAETVGIYDSSFRPKGHQADEKTFKSTATARNTCISLEAGVSVLHGCLLVSKVNI
jgi:hypothetical protein